MPVPPPLLPVHGIGLEEGLVHILGVRFRTVFCSFGVSPSSPFLGELQIGRERKREKESLHVCERGVELEEGKKKEERIKRDEARLLSHSPQIPVITGIVHSDQMIEIYIGVGIVPAASLWFIELDEVIVETIVRF